MDALLAKVTLQSVMSTFSAVVTGYFWLIKARKERPSFTVHQLQSFRASLRRGADEKSKQLSLLQTEPSGTLIVNHSTRQASIVKHEASIGYNGKVIKGRFGWVGEDRPPWNIGAESTLAMSMACFFDVPADCELPDEFDFSVEFVTAGGYRFTHIFDKAAPEF